MLTLLLTLGHRWCPRASVHACTKCIRICWYANAHCAFIWQTIRCFDGSDHSCWNKHPCNHWQQFYEMYSILPDEYLWWHFDIISSAYRRCILTRTHTMVLYCCTALLWYINHHSISFSEKLTTLHMPSDKIYALQKSLHRYSSATLSALRGLGLIFHDLITIFTPWPDANQEAEHQRAPVALSSDCPGRKSGLG